MISLQHEPKLVLEVYIALQITQLQQDMKELRDKMEELELLIKELGERK